MDAQRDNVGVGTRIFENGCGKHRLMPKMFLVKNMFLANPFKITLGSRFMGTCGSGNVKWMCTQLFGLADLLQSGYGTCVVRISCFFELMILVIYIYISDYILYILIYIYIYIYI